ncbi:hypothetical protein vseg_005821 [Gypsophila vaccaria]
MATNVKGGSFGREKKGTSGPSTSLPKKVSKPSSSTASILSSPMAGKPIPNYLKPTMSSSLDFSRLPKKSPLDLSPVQKPVINRRRSFDRPPPASSLLGQGTPSTPGGREIKHVRSTSFSNTKPSSSIASGSTRPAIERVYGRSVSGLKDAKVVEPLLAKSRTLKKSLLSSTSPIGKKVTKTAPKRVSLELRFDHDHDHEQTSSAQLGIEDDFVGIDSEVDSLSEISEMPNCNQELGDPAILDVEKDETVADHTNLGVVAETHQRVANVEQTETLAERNKEELDETTSISNSSASAGASTAAAQTGAAGKKDKQEYNDVIEETATKLMGGNKNKVLALAGAFETVISLQDTTTGN